MAIDFTYIKTNPTGFAVGLEVWYEKKKCEKGDCKVFGFTTWKVGIAFSEIKTVGKRSFEWKSGVRLCHALS